MKSLEVENGKLKKMLADRLLEIEVMKEIAKKNGERVRSPAAGRVRKDAHESA